MDPERRMGVALELFDAAVEIKRQNLKRRYPTETEAQIDARLRAWVRHRPGAEFGDSPGPLRSPR